jgi:hypothetical protein
VNSEAPRNDPHLRARNVIARVLSDFNKLNKKAKFRKERKQIVILIYKLSLSYL